MAKTRSPNYPGMDLKSAVERAELIYKKDFLRAMPPEVAAQHLGYTSLNGASLTTISALKKYGLLEGRAEALRLSKDAQIVIEKLPGFGEVIDRLAFTPALWNEICVHFDGEVPSEGNLRALLLKKGFNPGRVGSIIKDYIATVEFTSSAGVGYVEAKPELVEASPEVDQARVSAIDSVGTGQSMVFPMGSEFVATIRFSGKVTKKRLEKLIAYVMLAKDDYPDEPSAEERPTTVE